jgi:hypothetical protein
LIGILKKMITNYKIHKINICENGEYTIIYSDTDWDWKHTIVYPGHLKYYEKFHTERYKQIKKIIHIY